jgi:hypothetical protein
MTLAIAKPTRQHQGAHRNTVGRKKIPCMCCRQPFSSEDVLRNRICTRCKSKNTSPYAP